MREYIGARYVPLFYEGSDLSNTWESGVIYEPLTIVTYHGNSYTSKKKVPSTVGTPPANPEYWINTGNFNGQINALTEIVNANVEQTNRNKDAITDLNASLNREKEERQTADSTLNQKVNNTITVTNQLTDSVNNLNNADQYLNQRINTLQNMVGSPNVAHTKSAMTDHNKVYVYTGSESGMVNGNWYYWDGDSWESGGVYNAVAVSVDSTLSVSGAAADAKVTGDNIRATWSNLDITNVHSGYITTNVNIGDTVDTSVTSSSAKYQVIEVKAGEGYLITGQGLNAARLWAFTDQNYVLLSKSDYPATGEKIAIIAPANGYLICNFIGSSPYALAKVGTYSNEAYSLINDFTNQININNALNPYLSKIDGTALNGTASSGILDITGNFTNVGNAVLWHVEFDNIEAGKLYKIHGQGYNASYAAVNWLDRFGRYVYENVSTNVFDYTGYHVAPDYAVKLIVNERKGTIDATAHEAVYKFEAGELDFIYSPLYGKKVAWYGDSIIRNGWWDEVSTAFNMDSTMCGVDGTKISGSDPESMCQTGRVSTIPSDSDYIIIGGGTNDWAQSVAIGSTSIIFNGDNIVDDSSTFAQACHMMFRKIASIRPNAKVIVLGTPFAKYANRTGFANAYGLLNGQNKTAIDYGNIMCDIAEQYGFYALRYGNVMGINDANCETYLPSGGGDSNLHPTSTEGRNAFRHATLNGLAYIKF